MKKRWLAVCCAFLALSLCACGGDEPTGTTATPGQSAAVGAMGNEATPAPSAGEDGFRAAQVVETGSGVTVMTAKEWSETYPDIYASYLKNSENSEIHDYPTDYPMIQVLYEGMGFSKYYGSARGHVYTIDDVTNTGRPHALANCFSCKTPDYTALVNEMGNAAYSLKFEDALSGINEPISCYNCHANTGDELVVTHTYLADAMGDDLGKVDARDLSCGQCHVEYYFAPADKATTLPYDSLASMSPDEILDFYNNELLVDGLPFSDYTNPRTGVRQIKVQHPEFETFMGEGSVHAGTFTCADCHMGEATAADGSTYPSHTWTSPLTNQALIDSTCSACHADLAADVKAIQEEIDGRTVTIGNSLAELTEKLAAAVESGDYTEEELDAIRAVARDAQFYWDFVFVENSEGAHNSKLDGDCLDKAEALTAQAMELFKD